MEKLLHKKVRPTWVTAKGTDFFLNKTPSMSPMNKRDIVNLKRSPKLALCTFMHLT